MKKELPEYLFDSDLKALEHGIEATLSIQFVPADEDGKMEVLTCSVRRGYQCDDYSLVLDTTLRQIIEDLIR